MFLWISAYFNHSQTLVYIPALIIHHKGLQKGEYKTKDNGKTWESLKGGAIFKLGSTYERQPLSLPFHLLSLTPSTSLPPTRSLCAFPSPSQCMTSSIQYLCIFKFSPSNTHVTLPPSPSFFPFSLLYPFHLPPSPVGLLTHIPQQVQAALRSRPSNWSSVQSQLLPPTRA